MFRHSPLPCETSFRRGVGGERVGGHAPVHKDSTPVIAGFVDEGETRVEELCDVCLVHVENFFVVVAEFLFLGVT